MPPARSRSAARATALAALAAVLGCLWTPATAARAAIDGTFDPTCPIFLGIPQNTGTVVGFTGSLACYRPGGEQFGRALSQAPDYQRLAAPFLGAPCRNVYYHSVTFYDQSGDVRPRYTLSDGTTAADRYLTPDEQVLVSTTDVLVADAQNGTYQLSNPSDPTSPLVCQLSPTYVKYCPFDPTNPVLLCFIPQPTPAITPATSPPQSLAPYLAGIVGTISGGAGAIGSAPSQKGLVNTPTCFWIDGMGIPVERDLWLILPGAPDSSGRRIFYTYFIAIQFAGVQWNFDDPAGNDAAAPSPDCGIHPQLTAHVYRQISDGHNPDGRYHVTATESYTITITRYFIDSFGLEPAAVEPGAPQPAISPGVYAQYVGQVEGIPVNP